MNRAFTVTSLSDLESVMDLLHSQLTQWKVSSKRTSQSVLISEELLVELIKVSDGNPIHGTLTNHNGSVSIRFSSKGRKLEISDLPLALPELQTDGYDPAAEAAIRGMILRSFRSDLKCRWHHGVNTVNLSVKKSENSALITTMLCIACGLTAGLLVRFLLPANFGGWIAENILDTVYTMFINGVMMLVGPMVFFSMASCIADFRDLSALGRISAKVLSMYMCTTVFAVLSGFAVFSLLKPGDPSLAHLVDYSEAAVDSSTTVITLKSTIVNIIPSNLINAFANFDLIQIMVLGILIGIAAGMLGEQSSSAQNMLSTMNALFTRAVTMIVQCMPVVVFCSMAKMVLTIDLSSLAALLKIAVSIFIASILMLMVYCLLLVLIGRLNILTFLKKFGSVMTLAISLCASSAVMPFSMKALDEKIGVSPKIYSFSIPLGTTINMDGFCVYLVICILSIARIVGYEFSTAALLTLFLSIVLISLGAPGIPGMGVICVAMVLRQFGIPEALAIIILPVHTLLDPLLTMTNITGDAVITTIVAKTEGLLDEAKFRSL